MRVILLSCEHYTTLLQVKTVIYHLVISISINLRPGFTLEVDEIYGRIREEFRKEKEPRKKI